MGPRDPGKSVGPRPLSGVVVRPLNFTVRRHMATPLAFTLLLKVVLYFGVCSIGRRTFRGDDPTFLRDAFLLALGRFLIGLALAVPLWLLAAQITVGHSFADGVAVYVLLYGTFRWLAWSVIAEFVQPGRLSIGSLFVGHTSGDRVWRLSGVASSYVSDIPLLIAAGGPVVGPFFC